MISQELIDKIKDICAKYQEIKLLYVFGSVARGDEGPLSDYDFAVYLEEVDPQKRFGLRLKLAVGISKILESDKIDVVVINDLDNVNLKYAIISDGKIICEEEPYKMVVESRILNEYFDFKIFIDKYA